MSEWVDWHEGYAPGSPLSHASRGGAAPDPSERSTRAPPGPIHVISMCAGDGRDLLGVLPDTSPQPRTFARCWWNSTPTLRNAPRERAAEVSPTIEVVTGDASNDQQLMRVPSRPTSCSRAASSATSPTTTFTTRWLICRRSAHPNATVIWTRGTFAPDLTPTIRVWFMEAGFTELDFVAIPDTTVGVGANRLTSPPHPFEPDVRLFTFLPSEERPSQRGGREVRPGRGERADVRALRG